MLLVVIIFYFLPSAAFMIHANTIGASMELIFSCVRHNVLVACIMKVPQTEERLIHLMSILASVRSSRLKTWNPLCVPMGISIDSRIFLAGFGRIMSSLHSSVTIAAKLRFVTASNCMKAGMVVNMPQLPRSRVHRKMRLFGCCATMMEITTMAAGLFSSLSGSHVFSSAAGEQNA